MEGLHEIQMDTVVDQAAELHQSKQGEKEQTQAGPSRPCASASPSLSRVGTFRAVLSQEALSTRVQSVSVDV